jgi:hypothetical protein
LKEVLLQSRSIKLWMVKLSRRQFWYYCNFSLSRRSSCFRFHQKTTWTCVMK